MTLLKLSTSHTCGILQTRNYLKFDWRSRITTSDTDKGLLISHIGITTGFATELMRLLELVKQSASVSGVEYEVSRAGG